MQAVKFKLAVVSLLAAIACLETLSIWAQQAGSPSAREIPRPLVPSQAPPKATPPFAELSDIQQRWDYSDLVCTGAATRPKRTEIVKRIGDQDRDQLISWVTVEACFKGKPPANPLRVIGYDVLAQQDGAKNFIYAGPPPGFVTEGRNLLFLRRTNDAQTWNVTVPVYATCIPLAATAPAYQLDGSAVSIRRALAAEFEAVLPGTSEPAWYLDCLLEILGEYQGLEELKRLPTSDDKDLHAQIAMELLRHHDQAGEPDTISLLEDDSAPTMQRENAALALRNATSLRAERALERVITEQPPNELRTAAEESLSYIQRRQN